MIKISTITPITNPIKRQDAFPDVIHNYLDFADEVIILDGGSTDGSVEYLKGLPEYKSGKLKIEYMEWKEDFDWHTIGEHYQRGYELASGDWVFRMDIDYFFNERDFQNIRKYCEVYLDKSPALAFLKYQFLLADRYNIKCRYGLAGNKKMFGNRLTWLGGPNKSQLALDKKFLDFGSDMIVDTRIPYYNYDFSFKEESVIKEDFYRFAKARFRFDGLDWGYESKEKAWECFKDMQTRRFKDKSWKKIEIKDHPKYIQERIKNIKSSQFGYSGFSWLPKIHYAKDN